MRKPVRSLALLSVAAVAVGMGAAGSASASEARGTGNRSWRRTSRARSAWRSRRTARPTCRPTCRPALHVVPGKAAQVVYQSKEKGAEVGGASVYKNTVTFTITGKNKMVKQMQTAASRPTSADVGQVRGDQEPRRVDLLRPAGRHRRLHRPVGRRRRSARPRCTTGSSTRTPTPPTRPRDGVYVGDAAGNDILWVGNNGKVKTVAVLPADAAHDHRRGGGRTGSLPPAPWAWTTVRAGADRRRARPRRLALRQQPAGWSRGRQPGPAGRVYKVNPNSGKVKLVAAGFTSTVDSPSPTTVTSTSPSCSRTDLAHQGRQQQGQALHAGRRSRVRSSGPRATSTPPSTPSRARRSPKGKVVRIRLVNGGDPYSSDA